ncbi:hypothetical protein U9M48_036879 [Paspalum notatum var. saurae]|uniref:Uncharacterized protein n=1 Tax=Paspalum notatum var. saurae TaxID=547442 RepID=A0AAQ3UK20_PASNO
MVSTHGFLSSGFNLNVAPLETQDAHQRVRDHEDKGDYTGARERSALLQVLETSRKTTTLTMDGDELHDDHSYMTSTTMMDEDELDDDHFYDGWND